MHLNDEDFLAQWEAIVDDVHKTDIPLECIKKIIFKLRGRQQKTINLHLLAKQGLDIDEIHSLVTRMFTDLDNEIRDVDFIVDISAVAKMVQPETDKLLSKL